MSKDTLGDRMKGYESIPKHFLMKRTPVIIRLDGRAFHSFTKRKVIKESLVDDPFSTVMNRCMTYTALSLCKQIQGTVLSYHQSDEISLLLTDWERHDTQQWFGGNIQKIVSLSASMATNAFNRAYAEFETIEECSDMPTFDSRTFNLPREDVNNYFVWRQQDASRNSVNMLAQYHFSHKELQRKNNSQIQDMLMLDKGINWNDLAIWKKRGLCVIKKEKDSQATVTTERGEVIEIPTKRYQWTPDFNIPIFSQEQNYINQYL
jgi:tRNA(His) 5'-end guanylyltransferase